MLKDILPKEVLTRKDKMGFPVPLGEWVRDKKNPVHHFVMDLIRSKKFKHRGLYQDNIQKAFDEKLPSMRGLWAVICIELWHRTFYDR